MRDPRDAPKIGRLTRRADFLYVAKGKRWHGKAMTVQAAPSRGASQSQGASQAEGARIGFTLTRKVGNAVIRNKARRRLKEAVRLAEALPIEPLHDYVIIGRFDAVRLPFNRLRSDLIEAFKMVRDKRSHSTRHSEPRPTTSAP